jgi:predicted DNA-binding helix-hairpin-helix protein
MDTIIRLKALTEQMSIEPDMEQSTNTPYIDKTGNCPDAVFVHPAILPNGQKIKLLKTLLTSACERDCFYCLF